MSGIYNHRQMGPALGGRLPELLDSLRTEFDSLTQDVGAFHRQKDDVELKCEDLHSPYPIPSLIIFALSGERGRGCVRERKREREDRTRSRPPIPKI